MQIPFVGGSDEGRSSNINCTRSINFFPEVETQDSKSVSALVGTPGCLTFINFGNVGTHRMSHTVGDRGFVIVGENLYEIYSDGTYTLRGSFPTDTDRVVCYDNGVQSSGVGGNQMLLIDEGVGYIYNLATNTLTKITDAGFPANAQDATYIDGYFIVTNGTMGFWVSELYNGLVWPGLAFAAATSTSDHIVTCFNLYNQLFLIKQYSTEIWYDAGVPTSQGCPFQRVSGGTKDYGTAAQFSLSRTNNVAFFLATTRNHGTGSFAGVAVINGYDMQVVSTQAINYRISHFEVIDDAIGFCYADEGHVFYQLTFPTEDVTFVYDVASQMWHERSTAIENIPFVQHRHIAETYMYFNNRHYVGSYMDGRLLELSTEYYDDDGLDITSIRIAQPVFDPKELNDIKINKLIVDIETGVGDGSSFDDDPDPTDTANPVAWLSWSNDGGHTWSDEYQSSIGMQGQYSKRLIWRRLGSPKSRVFRLRISAAVKKVVLSARINDGALA